MSSSTLSGAANNKESPINWPADLREGRSPDVIYFWQVVFPGTSLDKPPPTTITSLESSPSLPDCSPPPLPGEGLGLLHEGGDPRLQLKH